MPLTVDRHCETRGLSRGFGTIQLLLILNLVVIVASTAITVVSYVSDKREAREAAARAKDTDSKFKALEQRLSRLEDHAEPEPAGSSAVTDSRQLHQAVEESKGENESLRSRLSLLEGQVKDLGHQVQQAQGQQLAERERLEGALSVALHDALEPSGYYSFPAKPSQGEQLKRQVGEFLTPKELAEVELLERQMKSIDQEIQGTRNPIRARELRSRRAGRYKLRDGILSRSFERRARSMHF